MKSSSSQRRVRRLPAKASAINPAEFEDYGPEPNMKLSHAFMVVLALHVIAVGGLFAFNKVKANHLSLSNKTKTEQPLAKEAATSETTSPAASEKALVPVASTAQSLADKNHAIISAAPTTTAVATKIAPVAATAVPANAAAANKMATASAVAPAVSAPAPAVAAPLVAPPAATGAVKEYTIVKGDNPYKIAKRFHVSYDSLIKLNNITDPRKIQIGQKIKIPAVAPHKTVKHTKHS